MTKHSLTLNHAREEARFGSQQCDHVLMLVVRKLDLKLATSRWIAKRKPNVIARRDFGVAIAADYRLRALEELSAMTAHARIVTGKVCYIRKATNFLPVRG